MPECGLSKNNAELSPEYSCAEKHPLTSRASCMSRSRNLCTAPNSSLLPSGRAPVGPLPVLFFSRAHPCPFPAKPFATMAQLLTLLMLLALCPSALAAESNAGSLAGLVKEFKLLETDAKKGGLRHNWINLSKKFMGEARRGTAANRADASYYAASSLHSLGLRSGSAADLRQAVAQYEKTATDHPRSPRAAESLYAAALISADRLKDGQAAARFADRAIQAAPGSSLAADAQKLKTRLASAGGDQGGGGPQKKPATTLERRAEQLGLTVKTIMLDPGHGGKDPGAEANGICEKDMTLKVARMLGDMLKKQGFTVLYTRSGDVFIPLEDRTAMANEKKADLFISIHVNANADPATRGLETYYLGEAASKSAAKVASRENAVEVGKVSDIQFILTDLVLAEKMKESRNLATSIHGGILSVVRQGKFSLPDHGVRSAMFYVLMGARMPAVLLELSYVTNKEDVVNLNSANFLQRQCEGIVRGVRKFQEDVKKQIR